MNNAPPVFFDAYDLSLPGPAFSNGFEGETWESAWCDRCAHGDECSLRDVAHVGRIPAQWIEVEPASLTDRWHCLCWQPSAGYLKLGEALGMPI